MRVTQQTTYNKIIFYCADPKTETYCNRYTINVLTINKISVSGDSGVILISLSQPNIKDHTIQMTKFYLDDIDSGILNLLQVDGELTYKELSCKLQRSKTNIVDRIKNLKAKGLIEKQVVLVDVQKIRNIFTAFPHVQLKRHAQDAIDSFKEQMSFHCEVMECYHVTGNFDFMLKIVTSDMVSYNEFLRDKIASNPLVGAIQSFMVLSQSKRETAYII